MKENKKEKIKAVKVKHVPETSPAEALPLQPAYSFKLITVVVPRGEEGAVNEILEAAGADVRMNFYGKGTANSDIMELFGLGDLAKDVITALVETEKASGILTALKEGLDTQGIVFTVRLNSIGGRRLLKILTKEET
jgi:hypothetical protein